MIFFLLFKFSSTFKNCFVFVPRTLPFRKEIKIILFLVFQIWNFKNKKALDDEDDFNEFVEFEDNTETLLSCPEICIDNFGSERFFFFFDDG